MVMYKLVLLGDGGVGKSCLTIQFVHNYFTYEYNPTIENTFRKQVVIDESCDLLEILDTAGQEEYTALRDQYIMQGVGFLLVYNITSRASFEQLPTLYNQILKVKDAETFPVVVVGNKCDLENQREVPSSEGRAWAKKINAPFFETSAKTKINLEESFMELVREVRKFQKSPENELSNNSTHSATETKTGRKWKCTIL